MEFILNIFSPDPAAATSTMLFGAIFFTFMFMFFLILGVTGLAQRRADIRSRMLQDRAVKANGALADYEWEDNARSLRFQSLADSLALLANVERGAKPNEKESEKTKLQRELLRAGYFGENSAFWYQIIRMAVAAAFPIFGSMVMGAFAIEPQTSTKMAILSSLAGIGFLLPGRYIVWRQGRLQQQCRNGFPDFMDLMVVCAEAGLGTRAAIDRIARDIAQTYPYLGANLYLMSLELRAGGALSEAVGNLAKRVNLEEVTALGSLLQQTEQLGTNIGDALRVYSDEMRDKRLSRAEEKAYALPVKLVLPLGIFVFPVMLVVIAVPVIFRIKNTLFQ
jgi:tight adherence protein C